MRYTSTITVALLFNLSAYLLVKLRANIYKNKVFKPMIWNIKLSLLPILILFAGTFVGLLFLVASTYLGQPIFFILGGVVFIFTLLLWLLFLPNSAYLITELNLTHRSMDTNPVPIWYDIIAVLTLSLSGIFNTILGIITVQFYYLIYFDPSVITPKYKYTMIILAAFVIVLVSFGIYLGREIRFNSWDIMHPTQFIKKFTRHLRKDGELKNLVLFVTLHSVFFFLMYIVVAPNFK